MKLKKKEDQSINASVLLRRGSKILMGGNTETKTRAETEGKVIQRLSHLGIIPYTDTKPKSLLQMPRRLADRTLI